MGTKHPRYTVKIDRRLKAMAVEQLAERGIEITPAQLDYLLPAMADIASCLGSHRAQIVLTDTTDLLLDLDEQYLLVVMYDDDSQQETS